MATNTVVIVVLGIVIVLIIDAAQLQIRSALPRPCRLIRALVLRDVCAGARPPGSTCTATITRGYFFGLLGRQARICACVLPGAGGAGGGVAPGGWTDGGDG